MENNRKTIVVSAVNIRKGGTLTILRDCLDYLSELARRNRVRVVALVHKKELAYHDNIEYIEMPWTIKSWAGRLFAEYVLMYFKSKKIGEIDLWLSLHDTTPNVKAKRRAVYCHNPFPFFKSKFNDVFVNYHIFAFSKFSKYIYQTNLSKNDYVIVQQRWLKDEFISLFNTDPNKVIISHPQNLNFQFDNFPVDKQDGIYQFIYPSFGDIHKNFEVLCEATELLEKELGDGKFRVKLTLSPDLNKYTKKLYNKWGHVKSLEFAGFMTQEKLFREYVNSDCMVFPSKVETWGLPITEFAVTGKPMLLSDLPYAHETAGGSVQTGFFNPEDARELAGLMRRLIEGDKGMLRRIEPTEIGEPKAETWKELFEVLLND